MILQSNTQSVLGETSLKELDQILNNTKCKIDRLIKEMLKQEKKPNNTNDKYLKKVKIELKHRHPQVRTHYNVLCETRLLSYHTLLEL